MLEFERYTSVF